MADTAMITMVAGLLGSTNASVGRLIHLSIALFVRHNLRRLPRQVRPEARTHPPPSCLAYGAVAWTLGALWITPANMGMPVFEWNDAGASTCPRTGSPTGQADDCGTETVGCTVAR
ncbi:hypothetical protein ABZZ20_08905 [Streptomyces sp. NPDC006430]|uniref:hypothetical protein n=1 Tax=Streptomyces sp. NPDC006430 TaxID=3154299 RepID=UPI0033AD2A76